MAATIQIHEMSAADTGTDKTSGTVRFKAADNATVDANDPLVIPGAGSTAFSYTKKLRAYMEAPPSTTISNLRWYSDGAGFGNDVQLLYKNIGTAFGSQYNTEMSGGTDFFTKVSSAAIDGDGTDTGPFVVADDDTYIGDIIEMQMWITSSSVQGALAAEAITLAYDEI